MSPTDISPSSALSSNSARRALPISTFHLSRVLGSLPIPHTRTLADRDEQHQEQTDVAKDETRGAHDTDVMIQEYDDRILVLITQNGKVGCVTQATLPSSIPILPPVKPDSTSRDPLPPTPIQSQEHPSLSILPHLPVPHPSISLLPILGTPRTLTTRSRSDALAKEEDDGRTINDMYTTHVASLIWWLAETGVSGKAAGADAGGSGGRKAVIVGLTLRPLEHESGPSYSTPGGEDGEQETVEDGEANAGMGMGGRERIRFAGVMGMVAEWEGGSRR